MQPAAAIRSSGAGSNKIADLPVHAHALPARRACSDRAATHWQNGQRPRGEPAATVPQTHSDCKANAQQSRCNRACIYMQIYSVCIQYSPCICDMDCLISGAYVSAYVSCMCFTYIQIFQSICVCMCLYVNGIQDHMHLIQPISGNRYIQIHAYTCRYIAVCITYRPVHMRYGLPYIWCICACICTLYVLQIQTHISIHMCVVCASDTCTYALAGSLMLPSHLWTGRFQ